jgi:hypothetical protein
VEINEQEARIILAMSDVCDCEGIGPDDSSLKARIYESFPAIVAEIRASEALSATYPTPPPIKGSQS